MDSRLLWIKNVYRKHVIDRLQLIQPKVWIDHLVTRIKLAQIPRRYPNYLQMAMSYEDWEPRLWPKIINNHLIRTKVSRRILSTTGQKMLDGDKNEQA